MTGDSPYLLELDHSLTQVVVDESFAVSQRVGSCASHHAIQVVGDLVVAVSLGTEQGTQLRHGVNSRLHFAVNVATLGDDLVDVLDQGQLLVL